MHVVSKGESSGSKQSWEMGTCSRMHATTFTLPLGPIKRAKLRSQHASQRHDNNIPYLGIECTF